MNNTLYYHYRDITPYMEQQIEKHYTDKGYTVYCVFLWYQEKEDRFFVDIEVGNGTPQGYIHIRGLYDYKTLDKKYNFILSEF